MADGTVDDVDDPDPLLQRSAADGIGGAVGAAAGLVVGGPAGAVVGGAAGPVVSAAVSKLLDRVVPARRRRADRMAAGAARRADMTADELVDRLSENERKLLLAAAALTAASNTDLEAKLAALAEALAEGALTEDESRLELESLFVAAVADIERPHLRVVQAMRPEGPAAVGARRARFTAAELSQQLPDIASMVGPALATLERHGVVERRPHSFQRVIEDQRKQIESLTKNLDRVTRQAQGRGTIRDQLARSGHRSAIGAFSVRSDPDTFRLTDWGQEVMRRIEEAEPLPPDPAGPPDAACGPAR